MFMHGIAMIYIHFVSELSFWEIKRHSWWQENINDVFRVRCTFQKSNSWTTKTRKRFLIIRNDKSNYNLVCDKKEKVQIYGFSDTGECKEDHSCHANARCKNTLGSHVRECHLIYSRNGQNCTSELNIFATIFRLVQHDTFDYSTAPFSRITHNSFWLKQRFLMLRTS